jgi:hypothetical protein
MTSILLVDTIKNSLDSADTVAITGGIYAPGSVVQVVQNYVSTPQSVSTASYTSVVTQAITPKSASSKIRVQIACSMVGNSAAGNGTFFQLYRGSTVIGYAYGSSYSTSGGFIPTNNYNVGTLAIDYLDSPATTAATTYDLRMGAFNGTAYLGRRGDTAHTSAPIFFTLTEIAQ